jgi:hypothetical protein
MLTNVGGRISGWRAAVVAVTLMSGSPIGAQATGPANAAATRRVTADFAGTWDTTYGPMTLSHEGLGVRGIYVMNGSECAITGTTEGHRLQFTYREPAVSGEGWFELAADGQSFSGQWRAGGDPAWHPWTGRRPWRTDSFTGLWRTSFGPMRLVAEGAEVCGHYHLGGTASIRGTVEGRKLAFAYVQPDGERGHGTFELAGDGRSFTGQWSVAEKGRGSGAPGGTWRGDRIEPQAGRTWLVVLEAHWEAGLGEHEYSYGHMLREFFRRTPHVEVRHRFFHDEADFRRFCTEVRYVAEPVIVYVSSHGSPEGILVGGATIGADLIAECLTGCGDVRLLHLGGCSMMQGDVPRRVFQALGSQARFPISGFTNVADWAGSAVIDFLYLDLILARKMAPADAADQVRQMMTFAREKVPVPGAVAPAGLRVLEPPASTAGDGPESRTR